MIRSLTLLLLVSCTSSASTFLYTVAVNTSSIAATKGTIDFQFNPGDVTSDVASAAVSKFLITGGGSLTGPPQYSGDATGTLPSSLKITNTANDNEALQALTFGTFLSFQVALSETLTGTALTGSVFNFGLFQADGFTPLLTTDPSGFAATINLNNAGGTTTATTTSLATVTAAPEPKTTALLFLLIFGAVSSQAIRTLTKPTPNPNTNPT